MITNQYIERKEQKMNVNDVQGENPQGDKLELIFEKQRQLMEKYHEIENRQGVGYGLLRGQVFNINEIRSQELLKNFAWRVTEELTEASVCFRDYEREHKLEEIADALHFLVELCIILEITPERIIRFCLNEAELSDKLEQLCNVQFPHSLPSPYPIIEYLGTAMNCLKQKPWKQTHVLTDTEKVIENVVMAFWELCRYWVRQEEDADSLYNYYFRKNKVNEFRIESNY